MIEVTVNMSDGTELNHKASCDTATEFVSRSVRDAIDHTIEKCPTWSSMVVVFSNPVETDHGESTS